MNVGFYVTVTNREDPADCELRQKGASLRKTANAQVFIPCGIPTFHCHKVFQSSASLRPSTVNIRTHRHISEHTQTVTAWHQRLIPEFDSQAFWLGADDLLALACCSLTAFYVQMHLHP